MPRKRHTVTRELGGIHDSACSGFTAAQREYLDRMLDARFAALRDAIREDTGKVLNAVLLEGTRMQMLRDLTYDVPPPPRA